jgi:formamidopyrimidine-DNA glycosylase
MPELPEVEHAARTLRLWLEGATVARARAAPTRLFRAGGRLLFERLLPGCHLAGVERRGKILLLTFAREAEKVGVLCHLGMTGKWVRRPTSADPPAHAHARLELERGAVLHYSDPRLFGRIEVHRDADLLALPAVRALGPDPLVDGLDPGALHTRLAKTRRPVKAALLDQALLAGVGNIYATEALFRAKIHPGRPANALSRAEVARLAQGIEASMAAALARPVEEIAYLSEGTHVENPFLVYDRAGERCPRCRRGTIEAITIGGRTSAFCGRCQRAG